MTRRKKSRATQALAEWRLVREWAPCFAPFWQVFYRRWRGIKRNLAALWATPRRRDGETWERAYVEGSTHVRDVMRRDGDAVHVSRHITPAARIDRISIGFAMTTHPTQHPLHSDQPIPGQRETP